MNVIEGRLVDLELRQVMAQARQRLMVEPGADLARVAQTVVLVVTDEECTEVRPRTLRRREAADHQLLLVAALELQPVARALAGVGARRPLGDDPLQTPPAGVGV